MRCSPCMEVAMLALLPLLKKHCLLGHVLGFAEIAQANPHEPKTLLWRQGHSLPQRQGDAGQFLARGQRRNRRMAPREDVKIARFQLQHYGSCGARFLTRCGPNLFREATDHSAIILFPVPGPRANLAGTRRRCAADSSCVQGMQRYQIRRHQVDAGEPQRLTWKRNEAIRTGASRPCFP